MYQAINRFMYRLGVARCQITQKIGKKYYFADTLSGQLTRTLFVLKQNGQEEI